MLIYPKGSCEYLAEIPRASALFRCKDGGMGKRGNLDHCVTGQRIDGERNCSLTYATLIDAG